MPTELEKLTAELSDSESLLAAIVEVVPDGVVVADADGKISYVNQKLETLTRYVRSELIGKKVELLVPENVRSGHERHRHRFSFNPMQRPMGHGQVLRFRRKDGDEVPAIIQLYPLILKSAHFTVVFIRYEDPDANAAAK